ncbi:MAG: UDP-glucose 4-epimerase GalE [Gammaproteobacteria bacterium]|nr:UDP-glucose 4-epimerase GalE [Gammaproteobacteria bacterium]MDE2023774.1 UDP-glucose 4-epimerase GalE [Gammaproteobacteria bacterium]
MKLLVTGGTGYIGSHTCVELLQAGHAVVIADNLSNSSSAVLERIARIAGKAPAFHKLDLRDAQGLQALLQRNPVAAVMHFAGVKAVAESVADPLKYYDNNVNGSLTLFAAMREFGVKRVVFSSSATVYGAQAVSPIGERAATAPANPYGRTKLMIEEMLRDLCTADPEFRAVALRYFNPVGAHVSGLIGEAPQGTPNNLMPYICQVAAGKLPELRVFGKDYPTKDGTAIRDYLHVTDLARGHVQALDYLERVPGFSAVNLGTGRGTSVLEMLQTFERVNQVRVPWKSADRRPGDTVITYADPALAGTALNWRTQRTLEDMCRDAWRWQKSGLAD